MTTKKPLPDVEAELYEVLADKTLSFGVLLRCIKEKRGFKGHDVGDIARVCGIGAGGDKGKLFIEQKPINSGLFKWLYKEYVSDWEIIGHEPTLNDVLLKLGEGLTNKESWVAIDNFGEIEHYNTMESYDAICKYNLTLSFDNQSESTKRAIHSLLCTKGLTPNK